MQGRKIEKIKAEGYHQKRVSPFAPLLKPLQRLHLWQVNEGVPGGLALRYGDLRLLFHRIEGRNARCTISEGRSKGDTFLLSADTWVNDYRDYYEAEI